MPFAAMWRELEIVMRSEVSQTEKGKYYMGSGPSLCGLPLQLSR